MRIALLALSVAACNSFTTLDEACLENGVPGSSSVDNASDVELAARANCHRRLAKRARAPLNPAVQDAVEGHREYLVATAPERNFFGQDEDQTDLFTGRSAFSRLEAEGYDVPDDAVLLEIFYGLAGYPDGTAPSGGDLFDYVFHSPFARGAWLQPTIYAMGVGEGAYTITYPETLGFPEIPVQFMYWNVIYAEPALAYAEVPVAYPRNGMTGVPPDYVHIWSSNALEHGRTYGYPVTFTVGTAETNVVLDQASMVGPGGEQIPIIGVTAAEASDFSVLTNTVAVIPDAPLATGATYTVYATITSSQGTRNARTTFTVGTEYTQQPGSVARTLEGAELPEGWVFSKRTSLSDR